MQIDILYDERCSVYYCGPNPLHLTSYLKDPPGDKIEELMIEEISKEIENSWDLYAHRTSDKCKHIRWYAKRLNQILSVEDQKNN